MKGRHDGTALAGQLPPTNVARPTGLGTITSRAALCLQHAREKKCAVKKGQSHDRTGPHHRCYTSSAGVNEENKLLSLINNKAMKGHIKGHIYECFAAP